jgi:hypothetical protein
MKKEIKNNKGPVAYPDSYRENKVSGLWAEKV